MPMSDEQLNDPAANTQKFQAFMDRPREPEPSGSRAVVIVVAAVAVVVVLLLAWLLLG